MIKQLSHILTSILILGLVLAVVGVWKILNRESTGAVTAQLGALSETSPGSPQAVAEKAAPAARTPSSQTVAETPVKDSKTPEQGGASTAGLHAQVREQVLEKIKLKNKIFRSPAEDKVLVDLSHNAEAFRLSSAFLRDESIWGHADFETEQNQVLDLFKMGIEQNSEEAIRQALEIIADPRVEDQHQPFEHRNTLAGIQAELMYTLLASAPSSEAQLQKSLAGPVHNQLYQNVTRQLTSNYQESYQERRAFEQNHSQ